MENESFEKNLSELEEVSNLLERGNLSLEEAITTFEKGIKLSKECSRKLDKAEKRINILIEDEDGLKEESFED